MKKIESATRLITKFTILVETSKTNGTNYYSTIDGCNSLVTLSHGLKTSSVLTTCYLLIVSIYAFMIWLILLLILIIFSEVNIRLTDMDTMYCTNNNC